MAKYEARLTTKYVDKATRDGYGAVMQKGRYVGGIHILPTCWTAFNEDEVNFDEIEKYVELGYLELHKLSEGPKLKVVEVDDEENVVPKKRGRPKREV